MSTEPGFAAFVWDERYAIGLPEVDQQHRQLIGLINRVGEICSHEGDVKKIAQILRELLDYTHYHFSTEEKMMTALALNAEFTDNHFKAHAHFHEQISHAIAIVAQSRDVPAALINHLLEYLTNWLIHHIMGMDMRMAREIEALQAGASHEEAAQKAAAALAKSADVLLQALNVLYGRLGDKTLEVMSKNRELENEQAALQKLNEQLDERVKERTRELEDANQQLLANNRELKQLNEKIESAQTQLLQSEKMASIGQLAAGVAHEINNPIGFVNSNLGTLKKYLDNLYRVIEAYERACAKVSGSYSEEIEKVKKDVDLSYLMEDIPNLVKESQDGLERVKRIVQDLRDFTHMDEAVWQAANLEHGLDSTLNVAWNEIKYKAEVVKEYGGLPPVECMPAQLNQVFLNLLVNAAQAIPAHGTITIRTGAKGDEAWVEVEDTGSGIPPEVRNRIFEPFFTTKPVGRGTGLGLSVSYGIVQKHGGRFEVDSVVGRGTRMRVWLPVKHADAKASP